MLPSAAALALAFVASLPGEAQVPPRQTPDLLVPVSTEVVRIDVVVTDKSGRPKQGLVQESFVVLEDGQPQRIAQFEAFVAAPPAPARATPATPGAGDGDEEPPARTIPPRRYLVLAVDDVHMEAGNLLRIKKALDRFLEREVGPEDRIALVTTSGTSGLYQEFTDDRDALRRSVERLSVQDRTVESTSRIPYITEYQAEQIERGDREALRVAVEEILQAGQFQDAGSAEVEAKSAARRVWADSMNSARLTLETLDTVVRGLSDLRGRKVVALVSDGFVAGLTTSSSAAFDIRRITDASTRAGVVIYALDTRGLVATSPGRSASSRMPMLTSTFGARDQMMRESEHATRDAMNALAADSGGFLVQGTNDLRAGLRRILSDTETYYLIAYEPTNTRRDGAFRKVEVRLPELRDARIRARRGYFAPDDRKRSASGPPLAAALTSLAPLTGIPVRLSADFVSVDAAGPRMVVSSHVDLSGVPFVRANGRHLATVDTTATVFDESGAVVGSLAAERAALDLTDASYEEAIKRGLQYQKAFPVKPGRYRVRVAAREDGEGRLGTASQWVQVPDLAEGKLTLSSLFLLRKEGDGSPSLRDAQALRRFRRGETLYVQHFAYNPGRDASGAASLLTQAEIWRGGVLLASTAPESMPTGERDLAPVAYTTGINLAPFGPGDYEVRIVVTDRNATEMASRRTAFIIE